MLNADSNNKGANMKVSILKSSILNEVVALSLIGGMPLVSHSAIVAKTSDVERVFRRGGILVKLKDCLTKEIDSYVNKSSSPLTNQFLVGDYMLKSKIVAQDRERKFWREDPFVFDLFQNIDTPTNCVGRGVFALANNVGEARTLAFGLFTEFNSMALDAVARMLDVEKSHHVVYCKWKKRRLGIQPCFVVYKNVVLMFVAYGQYADLKPIAFDIMAVFCPESKECIGCLRKMEAYGK